LSLDFGQQKLPLLAIELELFPAKKSEPKKRKNVMGLDSLVLQKEQRKRSDISPFSRENGTRTRLDMAAAGLVVDIERQKRERTATGCRDMRGSRERADNRFAASTSRSREITQSSLPD
jgi:hypothetical protein